MVPAAQALRALWQSAGLPAEALAQVELTGVDPVLSSSFAVGTAAQIATAAAALAATEIGRARNGLNQSVAVDMRHAALECCGFFTVNGHQPEAWDRLAGLYRCADDQWVRIHTNFSHHRDGILRLLGVARGTEITRETIASALAHWQALTFEQAAADAGLVVAALRTADAWQRHPQQAAIAAQPLVAIERIGDADPLPWPELPMGEAPLSGIKVLDLTRILAGPVAGRTLAAYGADVMLVNAPHLPNISAIIDTSRGKRSALADLRYADGREGLRRVLSDADVFIQGYRPSALAALGFSDDALTAWRPGLVVVSLSAYGGVGPWGARRGFDSLVQAATGFNLDEADAACARGPKPLPMQILDMASGLLMALGAQAALLRQRTEGGSWRVQVSLARTGQWLRELGRVVPGFIAPKPDFTALLEASHSGYGELRAMRHAAVFSHTPATWVRPSVPPGTDALAW